MQETLCVTTEMPRVYGLQRTDERERVGVSGLHTRDKSTRAPVPDTHHATADAPYSVKNTCRVPAVCASRQLGSVQTNAHGCLQTRATDTTFQVYSSASTVHYATANHVIHVHVSVRPRNANVWFF